MTPADQVARSGANHGNGTGTTGDHTLEIEQLNATIRKLESERDAAEGFAALAAHELMAPLVLTEACVSLAGERLADEQIPDLLQALEVLGRGAGRTRRLVESLLHEARSSGSPLRPERVDLGVLTHECLGMLRPEVEARSANVIVGPMPVVMGEAELLGGLITNLLMNALKFAPRQGAVVSVGSESTPTTHTFWVDSEGPAIPADDRERIFEPFHRGRGERRRARGAGLGLAICRRIAERHGGTIGIADYSAEDGNRFYVTLPA
jgi:chemotaxis family two-component system sensor kinase Cph1